MTHNTQNIGVLEKMVFRRSLHPVLEYNIVSSLQECHRFCTASWKQQSKTSPVLCCLCNRIFTDWIFPCLSVENICKNICKSLGRKKPAKSKYYLQTEEIFKQMKFQFWPARTIAWDTGDKMVIIDLATDIDVLIYRV